MNPREPHLLGQKPGTAPFTVYGTELTSRLLLGTALYPSPQIMADAVQASAAGIVTVSLRREQARRAAADDEQDGFSGQRGHG